MPHRILPTLFTVFALTSARADDRPNILFIMSDDHCSQAIGAYGGRLARLNPTPTIDRLAKEGMLFENAFCSNSICAPSRATILTGQYAHTCGAYDLGGRIETSRQYLALEMKKAGYQTAMIGKWHLKEEPGAFDYYKGQRRTPPGWELYDLRYDPTEVVNQYDNPEYAKVARELKARLAKLRRRVGDTGEDYPAVEAIIQEFWDYDEEDRRKAAAVSHEYLQSKRRPRR